MGSAILDVQRILRNRPAQTLAFPLHATGNGVEAAGGARRNGSGVGSWPRVGSRALTLEGLLDRLSAALVEGSPDTIETQLTQLLGQVAGFVDVDHAALAWLLPDDGPVWTAWNWVRPGCALLDPFDPEIHLPWITGRRASGAPVYLATLDDLPAESRLDRALL
jgi:hypothetical protein